MATTQQSNVYLLDTPVNRKQLLSEGKLILVAALDHSRNRKGRVRTVKLIFCGNSGERAYWINALTYQEYGTWLQPHRLYTVEDMGGMQLAKNTNIYDAEVTKPTKGEKQND